MRKICFAIVVLAVCTALLSSCKKCQECTITFFGVEISEEVCKDDFDSNADYRDAIKEIEDAGGKCK